MSDPSKIHYRADLRLDTHCGTDGRATSLVSAVTCRTCRFRILAYSAPWASAFLDDLRQRGKERRLRKPAAVSVPGGTAAPVHAVIDHSGNGRADTYRYTGVSEEQIRELLSIPAACSATVQPIVNASGFPGRSVGVEGGDIPQNPGVAGQIGDKPDRDF